MEFILGNKNAAMLAVFQSDPAAYDVLHELLITHASTTSSGAASPGTATTYRPRRWNGT